MVSQPRALYKSIQNVAIHFKVLMRSLTRIRPLKKSCFPNEHNTSIFEFVCPKLA
jgi:hypothetical protein